MIDSIATLDRAEILARLADVVRPDQIDTDDQHLKDASVDDLVRAITSVQRGQSVLARQAADRVHRQLTRPAGIAHRPFPQLTAREHDLLAELVDGRSNHEIARKLGLTDKTVRNYLANILAKLHARDRAQLLERARAAGYEPSG